MPPWAEQQRDFAAGLLDPGRSPPAGVVDPDGACCPRRYGVYRNNVVVGLVDVLAESFPAVRRLVGEDFFLAMAADYARREPPLSPVLLEYGEGFPAFIEEFGPASELPYLADVARIERLWIEAYHAPDAEPLDGADFASVRPDLLGDLRLDLHPSLGVLRSPYPALTIWAANLDEGEPTPLDPAGDGENILVVRPDGEVMVRAMPCGAAEFLLALAEGSVVAEAFHAARLASADFDLATALAELIPAGAFVRYQLAPGAET